MRALVPAILPASREDLIEKLGILAGTATQIQIDAVDGVFAPKPTWPYSAKGAMGPLDLALPHLHSTQYETDLMVSDPEASAAAWIDAGANRLTLHVESTNYLAQALANLQVKYGHAQGFSRALLSLGLALNVGTETDVVEPFLDRIDYVQFMGIAHIGKQGEPFDENVIRKIKLFIAKHPEVPVQVDGGVSREQAKRLLSIGVQRLVVGSAIWNAPDPRYELHLFNELIAHYGLG